MGCPWPLCAFYGERRSRGREVFSPRPDHLCYDNPNALLAVHGRYMHFIAHERGQVGNTSRGQTEVGTIQKQYESNQL